MIVVGLDLSLRSTGCVRLSGSWGADWRKIDYCVVEGGSLNKVATLNQQTVRLQYIAETIEAWIRNHRADVVALESLDLHGWTVVARGLAELHGVVRAQLLHLDVPMVQYRASEVRKTLLGKVPRRGAKDAVHNFITSAGAPWDCNDVSDAFAVANHHLSMCGHVAVTRSVEVSE